MMFDQALFESVSQSSFSKSYRTFLQAHGCMQAFITQQTLFFQAKAFALHFLLLIN